MRKFYFCSVPGQKGIPLFSYRSLMDIDWEIPAGPAGSVNGEISAFSKKFGRKSVAGNRRSDGDMGTAVARQAPKLVELV